MGRISAMKFDLHLHTKRHSPDSEMDPFEMLERAKEVGLDGLVITEHDWLWTEPELDELREAAPDLVVLSGIEVSARQGHFLVYGIRDPFALHRGIDVAALCREVHQQGGAVVAAHPYRWGQPFDEIMHKDQPELDGLEMMSKNMDPECRRQASTALQTYGSRLALAALGNSDAHSTDMLGICYTDFDATIRTSQDLVAAIRARRSSPCDSKNGAY
jgi:predicted metal-dependent phosphoesterase TrpH